MRAPIATLLLCAALSARAQELLLGILPTVDGRIVYSGVQQVDRASADELYHNAKRWFAQEYRSAQDVVQMDNPATREMIGKAYFPATWMVTFYAPTEVQIWFTSTVTAREGRYRYEFRDYRIRYWVELTSNWVDMPLEDFIPGRPKNKAKIYEQVHATMTETLKSLSAAMGQRRAQEDW